MMSLMMYKKDKDFPFGGHRILVYSPNYPVGDSMRWRLIDSDFLEMCKEATMWVYLDEP